MEVIKPQLCAKEQHKKFAYPAANHRYHAAVQVACALLSNPDKDFELGELMDEVREIVDELGLNFFEGTD